MLYTHKQHLSAQAGVLNEFEILNVTRPRLRSQIQ